MSRKFSLLVFDWDGTLMDSEARIVACVRAAVSDLALVPPDDEHIRNIIGLGLKEAVNALFPEADDDIHTGIVERYRHHFLLENNTPSKLFDGVEDTLSRLQEAGYLLAIATGKGRRGLDQVLASTALGRFFQTTRCADETFSKPHPEMLLQVMDEVGVEAGDTLMIGDTEYDMQMAANANALGLGVSYGVHSQERLARHSPVGVVHAVTDIPQWLHAYANESDLQV